MKSYFLKNNRGMIVEILDWGARIKSIQVPTNNGHLVNTVLGYSKPIDYLTDPFYMGCTIGRYANRIKSAQILLNGKTIKLSMNERETGSHLHGGFKGFDKYEWQILGYTEKRIELHLISLDKDEGYPGNLNVTITYELNDKNQFTVEYFAIADKSTIVNITNHSYFNLSDEQVSIDTHEILISAEQFSPLDTNHLPKKPFIQSVKNKIFDLRERTSVKKVKYPICNINYIFPYLGQMQEMAVITEKITGRTLRIFSDYPALQLYFSAYLDKPFKPFQGICCEPQFPPNSPNIDVFPNVRLDPNQFYKHKILYHFENFN